MKRLYIDLGAALAVALVLSALASGQNNQATSRTATIMGTVTDVNGDAIPDATVVLKEVESNDPRTIVTTETGMFEFHDVTPGITCQLSISAKDFADWVSPPIILNPDQFKIVTGIQLRTDDRDEVQAGSEGLDRSSYGCGSLPCGQCQASWKYSGLWPRLGSIWKALWRSRRRWFF